MNWLDAVLGIVIGASTISGLMRGFARTVVGFAAAVIGLFLAIWFYGTAGSVVLEYVSHRSVANFLGFVAVFLLVMLAGALIGRILAKLFKWVGLGWLDRLLGGGLGLLRGGFVSIGIVMIVCAFSQSPPPPSVVESRIAPYILGASSVVSYAAPRELKDAFNSSYDKVKKVWKDVTTSSSSI